MREKELIVYKDFGLDTSLLMDMVWLMEHYGSGEEGVQKESALLYDCCTVFWKWRAAMAFPAISGTAISRTCW